MRLIKPSYQIWEQEPGLQGVYKQIEKSAKICYKSEGNITENSAKPFIDNVLLKRQHYSPLEHGTVYLRVPYSEAYSNLPTDSNWVEDNYSMNPYSVVKGDGEDYYITSNYRVLIENNWLDDLKYLCEPTEFHEKRITVHFTCNRGVWNEFIRHRALARTDDTDPIDEDAERLFSFSQESQRYCNYSTDKFGNEVTFIIPCWVTDIHSGNSYDMELLNNYSLAETENMSPESIEFIRSLVYDESSYFILLEAGWKPQQAREVLPNACKTELVMTGFVSQWKDFFLLRSNKYGKGGAHPSADELATPLYEEFMAKGYIK